jgi:hypothetical protein
VTVVVVVTVVLVVDVDVRVVPVMVALVVVIVTVEIVVLVDVHANPHITSQFVVANVRIASSLEKQSDFGIRNPHTIASVLPSQLPGTYVVVVSVEVLTVLVVAVVAVMVEIVVDVVVQPASHASRLSSLHMPHCWSEVAVALANTYCPGLHCVIDVHSRSPDSGTGAFDSHSVPTVHGVDDRQCMLDTVVGSTTTY